jgi:hypothetical protein
MVAIIANVITPSFLVQCLTSIPVVCTLKRLNTQQSHQMDANLRAIIDTMVKYLWLKMAVIDVGVTKEKCFVLFKMNVKMQL